MERDTVCHRAGCRLALGLRARPSRKHSENRARPYIRAIRAARGTGLTWVPFLTKLHRLGTRMALIDRRKIGFGLFQDVAK